MSIYKFFFKHRTWRISKASKCGKIEHKLDIEQMHPKNRDNPHCNMRDQDGCHRTAFEKCPKCKRCLFADGQRIY